MVMDLVVVPIRESCALRGVAGSSSVIRGSVSAHGHVVLGIQSSEVREYVVAINRR